MDMLDRICIFVMFLSITFILIGGMRRDKHIEDKHASLENQINELSLQIETHIFESRAEGR